MILTKPEIETLIKTMPHSYVIFMKNHEIDTLDAILSFNDNDFFRESKPLIKVYNYLHDIKEPPKCIVCGKPVKYSKTEQGYKKTCSEKCRRVCPRKKIGHYDENRRKEIVEKRTNTNLKKYGTSNPMQSDSVKEKVKSTNLSRHNGKWFSNREKAKQTIQAKYGVEHQSHCKETREKTKASLLKKYGVDTTFKSPEIKQKIAKTIQEKYGVNTIGKSKLIRKKAADTFKYKYTVLDKNGIEKINEKRRKTCQERFGTDSLLATKEFHESIKKSFLDKYGLPYHPNSLKALEDNRIPLLESTYEKYKNIDDYELITPKDQFKGITATNTWKCTLCGKTFNISGFRNFYPKCDCHSKNREQDELFSYIKTLCPDAEQNNRTVLGNGTEIDVYVPSKKIGFEFNGLYWHSDLLLKNDYHLKKTVAAENNGIRLIHIFEDEWKQKNKIVKNKILYLLHGSSIKPIWARLCNVKQIKKQLAKKFLDKYHIQGSDYSTVCYGLFYKNHIVAVSTFTKSSEKNNLWVLSRYATIASRRIVGGLGKIISEFIHEYQPKTIRTFADIRYSKGKMYETLGFHLTKKTGPIYWYLNKAFNIRIHRFNLRKNKLSRIIGCNKNEMTEKEMAKLAGFNRIYDCGQYVYELEPQT